MLVTPTIRVFLASLALTLGASPAVLAVSSATDGEALDTWRSRHGTNWTVRVDRTTGFAEMLYGGRAEATFIPTSEADWFLRGRLMLRDTQALTGVDPLTLVPLEQIPLPMAHLGTIDKRTVNFIQEIDGVPVQGARVHLLFDDQARLLSVHSTALPGDDLSIVPARLKAADAVLRAGEIFTDRHGLVGTQTSPASLAVLQVQTGTTRVPQLIWRVDLLAAVSDARPTGETLMVDAVTGEFLGAINLVHNFDVGGVVRAMVTPGTAPDSGGNPEQSFPMTHLRMTSSVGDMTTDATGAFNFAGVNGPLQVTCTFEGPFARVFNESGSEYSTSLNLQTGAGNSITMNPSSQALVTAQSNAFQSINLLRDWIRAINPADSHADFTAAAKVNLNQNCNAYFDGGSVNFFTPGGGCVNTSYSTVVAHEMGHWLNVRYGTGNGADGMGEGNADVWAMYLYDTPIMGEDFFGSGYIRSGLNNLQFCGDFNAACHGGEVHQEGKVWMGAAWKVREELNQTLGNALGDDLSNAIFLGWMAAYNQTEIKSIIEVQWLVLDDDDGDVNNGSPHYTEIEAGFAAQGWPGVDLHPLTMENIVVPVDSLTESGPYDAQISIVPHMGQSLTSSQLHYRINGGAWQVDNLASLPDDFFAALLPDVVSPAVVELWFSASDSLGNSISWPDTGAAAPASFAVGSPAVFLTDNMETGSSSWNHGSYGDTSSSQDEWENGFSAGKSGTIFDGGTTAIHWSDPTTAASGFNLWALDLGVSGEGRYGNDIHAYLRSPAYDCTGRIGTRLRFQRWASVHRTDELSVRVNGTVAWTSGNEAHILDTAWTEVEVDISGQADGQAAVVIEFEIRSNAQWRLGGWQIDDLQLVEFGPALGGCVAPTSFGPAKPSSTKETPHLVTNGTPAPGGGFEIVVQDAALNQPAFLFSGQSWALVPFSNTYRLVGAPFVREGNNTTSNVGISTFAIDVTPGLVGSTLYYQVWFRDPLQGDGTGLGMSRGLRINYCP